LINNREAEYSDELSIHWLSKELELSQEEVKLINYSPVKTFKFSRSSTV
jgi:hypothetical protein